MIKTNEADSTQKNYAFEFYRFLFACIIFILHFWGYGEFKSPNTAFHGGYLGVEFFYLLSGFFMMEKVKKVQENVTPPPENAELLTVKYFLTRVKKLMPQYWISIVVLLLVQQLINPNFNLKKGVLKGFTDLFGLQIFWLFGKINYQLWFISGLLWAGTLVYYLLLKKRDFSVYIFFPMGLLIFLGFLAKNVGHIALIDNKILFLGGFFRAFFEIGFGCVLYLIYEKADNQKHNFWTISFLELSLTAVILVIMWRTRLDYKDFIMVFLIAGLILVTALNRGILSKQLNRQSFKSLGAISYLFYINSLTFQRIATYMLPSGLPFWPVTIGLILLTLGYCFLLTFLSRLLSHTKRLNWNSSQDTSKTN